MDRIERLIAQAEGRDGPLTFQPKPTVPLTLKRLDRVRIACGSVLIVTGFHPNRPANCWSGVKENGLGREYVFGPKHRPVLLGEVGENHPALAMLQTRMAAKVVGWPTLDGVGVAAVRRVVAAVEEGDLPRAKEFTAILRTLGF